ncbi:hypothetical protein KY285_016402 [Solanum tuberosum]|nr:hypothetical protein KY284_016400 [Solanum tuberosum]KAH0702124.1 hypothetical protein KY285_016402 [Solanum tuberosum]
MILQTHVYLDLLRENISSLSQLGEVKCYCRVTWRLPKGSNHHLVACFMTQFTGKWSEPGRGSPSKLACRQRDLPHRQVVCIHGVATGNLGDAKGSLGESPSAIGRAPA